MTTRALPAALPARPACGTWPTWLPILRLLAILVAAGGAAPARPAWAIEPAADADLHGQLAELAAHFSWAPLDHGAPVVQITVTGDPGGDWHLVPRAGGDVELRTGKAEKPGFTCELDATTLGKLHRGEMSGMTAAGKGAGDETSPLEILPGSAVPENAPRASLGPVFHFLTHFWNRGDPEITALGRDHARVLSGAELVGLYYHPGFRSAWYSVKGKESLNGEGDASPYPQAYVVVRGRARMRHGQRWIEVGEGHAVYVPPGTVHAIRSQDGGEVELIWLAWGDGA